jgi:hypothetical protein
MPWTDRAAVRSQWVTSRSGTPAGITMPVSAERVGGLRRDAAGASDAPATGTARHPDPGDAQPMVVALAWASLAIALLPLIVAAVRAISIGAYRRDLVAMAREDLLDVSASDEWRAKLDRYADLPIAWDDDTVAAWLGPVADGPR